MQRTKGYPQRKKQAMSTLEGLVSEYPYLILVNLYKVRTNQTSQLRKKFRDDMKLYSIKNNLANMVLSKDPKLNGLTGKINGQMLMILSKTDPFELNIMLNKNKITLPAKGGDIATDDITIPSGNTGLAPGPILSEFKEAKVPTKIDSGSIWVTDDTVALKRGEVVTPKLASLLTKLNIKAIKSGLVIRAAYYNGLILDDNDLRVDIDEVRNKIITMAQSAFSLAFSASYPSKEVLPLLITNLSAKAKALAIAAEYPDKETITYILSVHESRTRALLSKLREKGSQQ